MMNMSFWILCKCIVCIFATSNLIIYYSYNFLENEQTLLFLLDWHLLLSGRTTESKNTANFSRTERTKIQKLFDEDTRRRCGTRGKTRWKQPGIVRERIEIERRARTRRNPDTHRVLIKFSLAEYSRLARFSSPGPRKFTIAWKREWLITRVGGGREMVYRVGAPRLLANENVLLFIFFSRPAAAMRTNFHMNPG